MNEEVKIPELAIYKCQNPSHKPVVAEKGGELLCTPCVNEFLARNVGMMQEDMPRLRPGEKPAEVMDGGDL